MIIMIPYSLTRQIIPKQMAELSKLQDPKPPPIFIYGVPNYKDMVAHLSATIQKEQYQCKVISKDTIKIHVATPDSYRKLIKQLQEKKIIHHTYQMKQERAYRIVNRNLHYSTPTAQITAELEEQGHKVRNILKVTRRTANEPLFVLFINLEPNEYNKDIYDIKFLCNMKITVKVPRQRNTSFDAQDVNLMDTKTYCTKPYACVKYIENHNTTTCTKPPNTPAKCALCGGNIPQATKDVQFTRICKKKTEAS
jgi:hypothetical protein